MIWLLAHEKWFIDPSQFPLRWDLTRQPQTLAFIGGVLAVCGLGWVAFRARHQREILPGPLDLGTDRDRLTGFYGLVPAILALHLAVPLMVAGTQRNLFTVNNHVESAAGYFIGLAEVFCALAFFYGALTRVAAVVLALLWVVGIFVAGLQPMLDNVHILGFAAFFFLAGRGPISIDRLIFPKLEPPPKLMRQAIPMLRLGLGLGLTVVAFTEKLANQPMALSFLKHYPVNFTAAMHMPMSDPLFVLCAGSVELLVGVCIMLNVFPRSIIFIAWVPINLSLSYFNWNSTELIGHLPIYGIMALLVIWDPAGSHVPLWVRGLREGPLCILNDPHLTRPSEPAAA